MMDKTKELHDWLIEFVKYRDLTKKDIVNIEDQKTSLLVQHKLKKHNYYIITDVTSLTQHVTEAKENNHVSLVVPNQLQFVDTVIKVWDKLISHRFLSIFFVNPHAAGEKKWILFPCTHHNISDQSSLKQGLLSLFNGVEAYSI